MVVSTGDRAKVGTGREDLQVPCYAVNCPHPGDLRTTEAGEVLLAWTVTRLPIPSLSHPESQHCTGALTEKSLRTVLLHHAVLLMPSDSVSGTTMARQGLDLA